MYLKRNFQYLLVKQDSTGCIFKRHLFVLAFSNIQHGKTFLLLHWKLLHVVAYH